MRILFFLFFVIPVLFLAGCTRDKLNIDVSHIKLEVKIARLDKDLFRATNGNFDRNIQKLRTDYGRFFELYNLKIISVGPSTSADYPRYLSYFLKDYSANSAKKKVDEVFPTLAPIEKKLTDAFKHYKYYYPEKPVPQVYSFISGFNQSIVTDSAMIGIGLDKYLGSNCKLYTWLGTDLYKRQKMYKEKIATDCLYAWAASEFEPQNANNLLNQMIHLGKIMYFVEAMIPEEPDTVRFGFTKDQMEWCHKNEEKMWNYLVGKKLLFEVKPLEIKKFVDEGPFTAAFSNNSPAKTGVWIGYRIVCSYMQKHEKITLRQLMDDVNYQKILTLSKYRP
jgi:hypothetical protein